MLCLTRADGRPVSVEAADIASVAARPGGATVTTTDGRTMDVRESISQIVLARQAAGPAVPEMITRG